MAKYWVGNGGNWSDTAHWAVSSGGAGGASVPTSSDDVFFDQNSFSLTGQTVVLDVINQPGDLAADCKTIDWSRVTKSPTLQFGKNVGGGSDTFILRVAGSLILSPSLTITYYDSINQTYQIYLTAATGTWSLDTKGVNIGIEILVTSYSLGFVSTATFNLLSDLNGTMVQNINGIYIGLSATGIFNTNNHTINYTIPQTSSAPQNLFNLYGGILNLGSSVINLVNNTTISGVGGFYVANAFQSTINAGQSTINLTGLDLIVGNGYALNNVHISKSSFVNVINGGNGNPGQQMTINNLSINPGTQINWVQNATYNIPTLIATGSTNDPIIFNPVEQTLGILVSGHLTNAGSGYAVNDIVQLDGDGNDGGLLKVTSVDSNGGITGITILQGGTFPNYQTGQNYYLAGGNNDARYTVDSAQLIQYTINSTTTKLAYLNVNSGIAAGNIPFVDNGGVNNGNNSNWSFAIVAPTFPGPPFRIDKTTNQGSIYNR